MIGQIKITIIAIIKVNTANYSSLLDLQEICDREKENLEHGSFDEYFLCDDVIDISLDVQPHRELKE